MNVFRFVDSAGKEHPTENHHQYRKDYREDNVERLRRIAARVLIEAHCGDHKTDKRQQAI